MIEKFQEIKTLTIHDIHNHVIAGKSRDDTVKIILTTIPVVVAFNNVSNIMLKEFFEWMYEIAYLEIFNKDYQGD